MKAAAVSLAALILATALGPAQEPATKRWFKGNTHAHTLWSDGNDFPEMVAHWYKSQGYDFLAISDHNILMRGEHWMKLTAVRSRQKSIGRSALEKYLARFGDGWVEVRGEGAEREVRLKTLSEFRPHFEADGKFLLIEAEEITDRFQQQEVHINAVNLDEIIKPQHGESARDTIRRNLVAAAEQAKRLGRPVLTHLNHPNFRWSLPAYDLAHVVENQFFEVYNGHPSINHLGDKDRPGDEKIWDIANTVRLASLDAPPLMAVATDDSHHYHGEDVSPGRGWIMVEAENLEADTLIRAVQSGHFYASSGVTLDSVTYSEADRTLAVNVAPDGDATFSVQFIGTKRDPAGKLPPESAMGVVLARSDGLTASYKVGDDDLYVRAVITSSLPHPNPSFKGQMRKAWTQPVGWK